MHPDAGAPPLAVPPPPQAAVLSATLLARFRAQREALIGGQRPWAELLDESALSLPPSTGVALARLRRNFASFRPNYAVVVLAAVAAGFVFQPSSLVALAAVVAPWLVLYFSSGEQVVNGSVVRALSVFTILAFFLTDIGSNMLRSAAAGLALVGFHALVRNNDDLRHEQ